MNAYEHAQKLNLTGTDEQIVAVLQTLAGKDLPVSHVAEWLRRKQLWYRVPGGYAGPMQMVYDKAGTPQQIKDALSMFFASVWGSGAEYIRATWPEYSADIFQISGLLSQVIPDGEDLREEMYAEFAGRPYADLTVEEFASQRETLQRLAAVEPRKSTLLDRLADASQRCIAILDQWHRDIIDGKEATEPSTDELVAAFRSALEG